MLFTWVQDNAQEVTISPQGLLFSEVINHRFGGHERKRLNILFARVNVQLPRMQPHE
jgi:hypothetical protein